MGSPLVEELFETYDENGNPLGELPRSEVHRRGIWHCASNVFLFRSNGDLLIQCRNLDKDICPGAWDLSAAEHLKPGETYEQGAVRGLIEELGIEGVELVAIGEIKQSRFELAEKGIKDYEFQQSFRGVYDGPVVPDGVEVLEIADISLDKLSLEFRDYPDRYTHWFRERVSELDLLG